MPAGQKPNPYPSHPARTFPFPCQQDRALHHMPRPANQGSTTFPSGTARALYTTPTQKDRTLKHFPKPASQSITTCPRWQHSALKHLAGPASQSPISPHLTSKTHFAKAVARDLDNLALPARQSPTRLTLAAKAQPYTTCLASQHRKLCKGLDSPPEQVV